MEIKYLCPLINLSGDLHALQGLHVTCDILFPNENEKCPSIFNKRFLKTNDHMTLYSVGEDPQD